MVCDSLLDVCFDWLRQHRESATLHVAEVKECLDHLSGGLWWAMFAAGGEQRLANVSQDVVV